MRIPEQYVKLLIIMTAAGIFLAGCRLLVFDRFYCIKEHQLYTGIYREGQPTGAVAISVSVANTDYHAHTAAMEQRQDYYIECDGDYVVNITPIGDPIILSRERIACD